MICVLKQHTRNFKKWEKANFSPCLAVSFVWKETPSLLHRNESKFSTFADIRLECMVNGLVNAGAEVLALKARAGNKDFRVLAKKKRLSCEKLLPDYLKKWISFMRYQTKRFDGPVQNLTDLLRYVYLSTNEHTGRKFSSGVKCRGPPLPCQLEAYIFSAK